MFHLHNIRCDTTCRLPLYGARASSLLHYMGQFMRQKSFSVFRSGLILARVKYDMSSCGVGQCVDTIGRLCGIAPCMDAHIGKIIAETRLKEIPLRLRQYGTTPMQRSYI